MHTYRLKLTEDGVLCSREVEFEADDPLTAFAIVHQQDVPRRLRAVALN